MTDDNRNDDTPAKRSTLPHTPRSTGSKGGGEGERFPGQVSAKEARWLLMNDDISWIWEVWEGGGMRDPEKSHIPIIDSSVP